MKLLILAGAPKCGTTSLYDALAQVPGVVPGRQKEPNFYAYSNPERLAGPGADTHVANRLSTFDDYLANFAQHCGYLLDGSNLTGFRPGWLSDAAQHFEEVRAVVVLRDPLRRAHSAWLHQVRRGREPLDFSSGLAAEHDRIERGWVPAFHYGRLSDYRVLSPESAIPPEVRDRVSFRIVSMKDLFSRSDEVLTALLTWCGLDAPIPQLIHRNSGGRPRHLAIQRLLDGEQPWRRWLSGRIRSSTLRSVLDGARRWNLDDHDELSSDDQLHRDPVWIRRRETFRELIRGASSVRLD